MAAGTLTFEARAWAMESLYAGDPLAEIAEACELGLLDMAQVLGVYGYVPPSLRWRKAGAEVRHPFVGGMLREVAVARRQAGESAADLAVIARCAAFTMKHALVGCMRQRARRLQAAEAA